MSDLSPEEELLKIICCRQKSPLLQTCTDLKKPMLKRVKSSLNVTVTQNHNIHIFSNEDIQVLIKL